jgi:hypothetical protein
VTPTHLQANLPAPPATAHAKTAAAVNGRPEVALDEAPSAPLPRLANAATLAAPCAKKSGPSAPNMRQKNATSVRDAARNEAPALNAKNRDAMPPLPIKPRTTPSATTVPPRRPPAQKFGANAVGEAEGATTAAPLQRALPRAKPMTWLQIRSTRLLQANPWNRPTRLPCRVHHVKAVAVTVTVASDAKATWTLR